MSLFQPLPRLARALDRAFSVVALRPSQRTRTKSRAESLAPADRLRALAVIDAFYNGADTPETTSQFFPRPEPIAPALTRVRKLRGGEVLDLRWPSTFEPLWSTEALRERFSQLSAAESQRLALPAAHDVSALLLELGIDRKATLAEKYLRLAANRTVHARWFRHSGAPRPCAVLLHGYLGGSFAVEERVLPVQRLYRGGFDVVLTTLPFHGLRRSELRGYLPPAFPSSDPRFTIEGFRQLVSDHRGLFDYLRGSGTPQLGVLGMSLGGYSAALLATLEPGLRFAIMFIPLASIEDFAFAHGRMLGDASAQRLQRAALGSAQRAISPLSRPPLLAADSALVIGGEADHVTGMVHAEWLARHFRCRLSSFAGGHLLHVGRTRAFAPAWALLARAGLQV